MTSNQAEHDDVAAFRAIQAKAKTRTRKRLLLLAVAFMLGLCSAGAAAYLEYQASEARARDYELGLPVWQRRNQGLRSTAWVVLVGVAVGFGAFRIGVRAFCLNEAPPDAEPKPEEAFWDGDSRL